MLLTLKIDITKCNEEQKNIIHELSWYIEKVYNTLLHEIKENKRDIDLNKSLNILSSGIYTEYRKNNWHSNYLHSHTLQQVVINVVQNYKAYMALKEMYNIKRRIHRGLFVTNKGKQINADINGSLNILRKYITNNIPNLEIAMDNGKTQRPIKKRVA